MVGGYIYASFFRLRKKGTVSATMTIKATKSEMGAAYKIPWIPLPVSERSSTAGTELNIGISCQNACSVKGLHILYSCIHIRAALNLPIG